MWLLIVLGLLASACGAGAIKYSLTSSVEGEGRVVPSAGEFAEGKVVWVQAVPAVGWQFDGWSGDGEGLDQSLLVEIDGDRLVVANFSQVSDPTIVNVNLTIDGSGSASADSKQYTRGEIAEVRATPDTGWAFDGWTGDFQSSDEWITFAVRANVELTAHFVQSGPDTTGPAERNVRVVHDSGDMILTFKTSEPATTVIEHGLTDDLESRPIVSEASTRSHRVVIGGYTADAMVWYRIRATDQLGNETVGPRHAFQMPVPGLPVFDFWYGNEQTFGSNGRPQRSINIVGNVVDSDGIDELHYSLNGSVEKQLGIGPDGRRLVVAGDFNAELDTTELVAGSNVLTLRAVDGAGNSHKATVLVDWKPTSTWPMPYSTDWETATGIADRAQVVDGNWELDGDGVRLIADGYDRILVVGDSSWSNYEAIVSFEVHSIDVSGFNPRSISPLVGMAMGWSGHTKRTVTDSSQPLWYFWPTGAFTWYKYSAIGDGFVEVRGNKDSVVDTDPNLELVLNIKYTMKVQSVTEADGVTYRMKIWDSLVPEPRKWNAEVLVTDGPESGALALIAHHVDATFGDLFVTPIG